MLWDNRPLDDRWSVFIEGAGRVDEDVKKKRKKRQREAEKGLVAKEVERMKEFVSGMTGDDVKNGTWFPKLLAHALENYVTKIDASYFRASYPDLPVDAIVDARIRMAARYASIEGGLSASAYTAAVAGTIGTLGGASPLTVSAGAGSFVVDMAYTTQIQLRTAYDISVLYGVPIDINDPDDMWKLVKIAFAIKTGEIGGVAVAKGAPAFVRHFLKKYYSGAVLTAARSLPVIGKHLLQRNVIKFAIPVVGVPVSATMNYWTTQTAGKHAKWTLRHEAKLAEAAGRAVEDTTDLGAMLWVLWLVMRSDGALKENETLLYHHASVAVRRAGGFEDDLDEIQSSIVLNEHKAWDRVVAADGAGEELYRAGVLAAVINGTTAPEKLETLKTLAELVGVEHSPKDIRDHARKWSQN